MRILFYVLPALLVASSIANAQDTAVCKERTVAVNVIDREGEEVAGLPPTAFRGELRGQLLEMKLLAPANTPRRIVILVDLSGSTRESARMARLMAGHLAVHVQQNKLQPALVLFSDRIIDTVDFSQSREEVVRRLVKLPDPHGRTALFDALKYAANLFGQPSPGDSVYLISDGYENASKIGREEVTRELVAKRIRLYILRLGGGQFFATEEENTESALAADLAEATGGSVLNLYLDSSESNSEHTKLVLQRLYRQMADFYEMRLQMPAMLPRKWQPWNLEVVDERGKKRKDIHVIYPHTLAPCGEGNPID
jgi:Mg-chelatase subunit ChlD